MMGSDARPQVHGRFFSSGEATIKALIRFEQHHAHRIESFSLREKKIVMKNGTRIYFRTLQTKEDVMSFCGVQFSMVDIDPKITDEWLVNFTLSRLRL